MTDCRRSSSSLPISSMSSAVRWAIGLWDFFCRTVTRRGSSVSGRSVVDVAGAGGGADAGLDEDAVPGGGGGDLAGAQVADGALAQREHAAVADAHAAAAGHEDAGLLGGVEDRGGPVGLDARAEPGEGHRAALAGDDDRRPEALGEQPVGDAGGAPVLLERLEHADRTADRKSVVEGKSVDLGGRRI